MSDIYGPDAIVGTLLMRSGDRLPLLAVAIEDDEGVPLNLTTATRVDFFLRCQDGSSVLTTAPPLDEPAGWLALQGYIVDPAAGIVVYDWQPDTAAMTVAVMDLMVVVTFPGDVTVSAPSDRTAFVVVRPDATPTDP